MINIFYYILGLIVYVLFSVFTFNIYSKKKEVTNIYVLFFIYVYYSILAGYIIQMVDYNPVENNFLEVIFETIIFMVLGGLYLLHYYYSVIKVKDEGYDMNLREV